MKRLAVFILLCTFSVAFAALVIDVSFEQDIIGPAYSANGSYLYETDWITMTNASNETETFSIHYTFENLPDNWSLEVGNSAFMFQPNYDNPVLLGPGDSDQIYAVVGVESGGGDREDPIVVDFTFNTADSVGVEIHLSNGVELNDGKKVDLEAGEKILIKLTTTQKDFIGWSAHPEVGEWEHENKESHEGSKENHENNDSHEKREGREEH